MIKQVGNFRVDVWEGGYPVWIHIEAYGQILKFSHVELRDLEYAVEAARTAATLALGERHRPELGKSSEQGK